MSGMMNWFATIANEWTISPYLVQKCEQNERFLCICWNFNHPSKTTLTEHLAMQESHNELAIFQQKKNEKIKNQLQFIH